MEDCRLEVLFAFCWVLLARLEAELALGQGLCLKTEKVAGSACFWAGLWKIDLFSFCA